MSNELYVHIVIELKGNPHPALFADKVMKAMPAALELAQLRGASMEAELPVTFRIKKNHQSDPQNYLQISSGRQRLASF